MEKGRALARPFLVIWRVFAEFNIEREIHWKLDRFIVAVRAVPMVLVVGEHQAIAYHLLPSVHQRDEHLRACRLFNVHEQV